MPENHTTPRLQQKEVSLIPLVPTTPRRRGSSSSSMDHAKTIPSTPPSQSDHRRPFQSPDAYTHTTATLPPITPSAHRSSATKMGNVPQTPFGGETSPSPLKSPSQFKDEEDGERPPIRKITSKLRTRLNYAFVKYQHGWTNQSIDELERTVGVDYETAAAENRRSGPGLIASPSLKTLSPAKVTKPASMKSPVRVHRHSMDAMDVGGSAHAAFINAISKSKSPNRNASQSPVRLIKSPLRPPPLNLQTSPNTHAAQHSARSPEAEAIETLMALSSPHSFKPKEELPRLDLPRQRLSFGEKLLSNDVAVATESDTEYEGTDDEQSLGHTIKRDDDEDLQTASEHDD